MLSILNVSLWMDSVQCSGFEGIRSLLLLLLQQQSENNVMLTRHWWTNEMIWYNLFRTNARSIYIFVHIKRYTNSHEIPETKRFRTWRVLHMRHDYQIYKMIVRLVCYLKYELLWHERFSQCTPAIQLFHRLSHILNKCKSVHDFHMKHTLIRFALGKLHLNWMTAACLPIMHRIFIVCSCANYSIFQFFNWISRKFTSIQILQFHSNHCANTVIIICFSQFSTIFIEWFHASFISSQAISIQHINALYTKISACVFNLLEIVISITATKYCHGMAWHEISWGEVALM